MTPNDGLEYYRAGFALLGQNRNRESAALFERAAQISPAVPEIQHFWGVALQRIGKVQQAAACFEKAISLNPGAVLSLVELGHLLLSVGDPEAAVQCFQKVVELDSGPAKPHFFLARALAEVHRFDEAETSLATAISRDPNFVHAYVLRGRLLQQRGRFEEGEVVLRHAISLSPDCADGYYAITNGRKMDESDRPLIGQIERLIEGRRLSPLEQRPLQYALGKAYDDLGEYERAMKHFKEGNRLSRLRLEAGGRKFDAGKLKRQVDDSIETFTPSYLASLKGSGSKSKKPVFIVGMARSGTTLLDQIVSSHPRVTAAGELGTWREVESFLRPGSASEDQQTNVAERFLAKLDSVSPSAERVTVKTPQNYLILGQILAVFPNCRILHCRRSPVDTCLSIYTTNFANGPDFAHDLSDLVVAYREYLRVMRHWRQILPTDRFLDVSYEELVADRELVLRRVFAFLDLEWNESVLRHEHNEHPISTPSLWQARQPVYNKSVERWRLYQPWLGPLTELLTLEK